MDKPGRLPSRICHVGEPIARAVVGGREGAGREG